MLTVKHLLQFLVHLYSVESAVGYDNGVTIESCLYDVCRTADIMARKVKVARFCLAIIIMADQ